MKILLFSLLISISPSTWSNDYFKSINPDRVISPLHYVYKKPKIKKGKFLVKAPKWSKNGGLSAYGPRIEYSKDELEKEKNFARSVFQTVNNSSTSVGTSFAVGGNVILTNFHVYNNKYKVEKCSRFSFKLNPPQSHIRYSCKKIYACYKELDYCLIEVQAYKKKYRKKLLSERVPSVILKRDYTEGNDVITQIYGNVRGYGIQSSKGRGLTLKKTKLWHYSPLNSGASGGPLVDKEGKVIGLVYAQSKTLYGPKAVNLAYPIDLILEDLREKIPTDIFSLLTIE